MTGTASRADSSALRAATEGERRARERLQAIFDGASLGIVGLDRDGTILEANPALQALLGEDAAALRELLVDERSTAPL